MPAARRRFLSDLWKLTKPYWKSEERFKSGLLLAVIIGMSLGIVYLNVLFNEWNNLFYNSLQEKNIDAFFRLFGRFAILIDFLYSNLQLIDRTIFESVDQPQSFFR